MNVFVGNHIYGKFGVFCLRHYPRVGYISGPSNLVIPKKPIPYVLDNDAYTAWKTGNEWDVHAWRQMLNKVERSEWKPAWILIPDAVADRQATIDRWHELLPEALCLKVPIAFAVQDGMSPQDVPGNADVVFIGGSTKWKWRTLPIWTKHFKRVHVGRVNTGYRLEIAERNGAESCDGSGWLRKTMEGPCFRQLRNFIEGHRDQNLKWDFA